MSPFSDRFLLPLRSNDNGADHEDETRHAARHRQDDLPRTDALAVTVVAVLASIVNKISFMLLDLRRHRININTNWYLLCREVLLTSIYNMYCVLYLQKRFVLFIYFYGFINCHVCACAIINSSMIASGR